MYFKGAKNHLGKNLISKSDIDIELTFVNDLIKNGIKVSNTNPDYGVNKLKFWYGTEVQFKSQTPDSEDGVLCFISDIDAIGDLSDLTTTIKTNLVDSINEVNGKFLLHYTKTESDNNYAKKTDLNSYVLTTTLNDYYTKTESDNNYAKKTDLNSYVLTTTLNDYYTKTESDGNYVATTTLNDYYTKTESDGNYYTKTESDGNYVATTTLNDYYNKTYIDDNIKPQLSSNTVQYSTMKAVYFTAPSREDIHTESADDVIFPTNSNANFILNSEYLASVPGTLTTRIDINHQENYLTRPVKISLRGYGSLLDADANDRNTKILTSHDKNIIETDEWIYNNVSVDSRIIGLKLDNSFYHFINSNESALVLEIKFNSDILYNLMESDNRFFYTFELFVRISSSMTSLSWLCNGTSSSHYKIIWLNTDGPSIPPPIVPNKLYCISGRVGHYGSEMSQMCILLNVAYSIDNNL